MLTPSWVFRDVSCGCPLPPPFFPRPLCPPKLPTFSSYLTGFFSLLEAPAWFADSSFADSSFSNKPINVEVLRGSLFFPLHPLSALSPPEDLTHLHGFMNHECQMPASSLDFFLEFQTHISNHSIAPCGRRGGFVTGHLD